MNVLIKSIEAEFHRYKALAEAAVEQVPEASLSLSGPAGNNSLAALCWHVSGNLQSRFTDFLTSDGEKSWRRREEEFEPRVVSRVEILAKWTEGWNVLFSTLDTLADVDLAKSVVIRGQNLAVHEALHRSLAHVSYHVGQIVYLARSICGGEWRYLSIPPGGSAAYNNNPSLEKPEQHEGALRGGPTA